jgi:predicted nuclease with TOPRIM domain
MTSEEIEDVFDGKDMWFNAIDMCRRGMATHVITNDGLLSAEAYLEKLDNPRKGKISVLSKEKEEIEEIMAEFADKLNEYKTRIEEINKELSDYSETEVSNDEDRNCR